MASSALIASACAIGSSVRFRRPLSARSCARVFSSAGVSSATGASYCTTSTPGSAANIWSSTGFFAAARFFDASGFAVSRPLLSPISPTRFISSSNVGPFAVISAIRRFASSRDSIPSVSPPIVSATGSAASAETASGAFFAFSSVGRMSAQFTVLPSDFGSLASDPCLRPPDLAERSSAADFASLPAALTSAWNELSRDPENRTIVRKYPAT